MRRWKTIWWFDLFVGCPSTCNSCSGEQRIDDEHVSKCKDCPAGFYLNDVDNCMGKKDYCHVYKK